MRYIYYSHRNYERQFDLRKRNKKKSPNFVLIYQMVISLRTSDRIGGTTGYSPLIDEKPQVVMVGYEI